MKTTRVLATIVSRGASALVVAITCVACGSIFGVDFGNARPYDEGGAGSDGQPSGSNCPIACPNPLVCSDNTCAASCDPGFSPCNGFCCANGATGAASGIAAGEGFACAIVAGGTVKCWGDNQHGQLGNPTAPTYSQTPVSVADISGATAIGAGSYHACAIILGGAIHCWGDNGDGQLGTDIELGGGYTSVVGGNSHTCGLNGGQVRCWGNNNSGQLGSSAAEGTLSTVDGLTGVTQISSGVDFTCALASGAVKCWGDNLFDTLGGGPPNQSSTPVAAGGTNLTSGVVWIGAGDNHACAALSNGIVDCWGENSTSALGVTAAGSLPFATSQVTNAKSVFAGGDIVGPADTSCAITTGGGLECWGDAGFGELGNGTSAGSSAAPANVSTLASNVSAVALGGGFTCALTTDGVVKCWGTGAIGPNAPTSGTSAVPIVVTGL